VATHSPDQIVFRFARTPLTNQRPCPVPFLTGVTDIFCALRVVGWLGAAVAWDPDACELYLLLNHRSSMAIDILPATVTRGRRHTSFPTHNANTPTVWKAVGLDAPGPQRNRLMMTLCGASLMSTVPLYTQYSVVATSSRVYTMLCVDTLNSRHENGAKLLIVRPKTKPAIREQRDGERVQMCPRNHMVWAVTSLTCSQQFRCAA